MTNGRNKGAAFEREVAALIDQHLGVRVKRDLEQYRESQHGDLLGLDGWVIECKRYAMANGGHYHRDWWQQVINAAISLQQEPVLIYKYDRAAIHCVVRLGLVNPEYASTDYTCTVSFSAWCMLVREKMCEGIDADLNP
jgi:hypothetical protein